MYKYIFAAIIGSMSVAALMFLFESLEWGELGQEFAQNNTPNRNAIREALGISLLDIEMNRLDFELRMWHALSAASTAGLGLLWVLRRR